MEIDFLKFLGKFRSPEDDIVEARLLHKYPDIAKAQIDLCKALRAWTQETGRETVVIIVERGPLRELTVFNKQRFYGFFARNGKPHGEEVNVVSHVLDSLMEIIAKVF